ncbi:endoplasmic oxidoreductin-1 [Agyrium rufum]|nr:endoplasmic oxidoreductin-1 [Agyrium rufum]
MRSASQVFYLAVFLLLSPSHAHDASPSRSATSAADICAVSSQVVRLPDLQALIAKQIEPGAIVSDACASYQTLDYLNKALSPALQEITQTTDFFGYYRLNLFNKACPFWNDANSMCGNIACAVNTLENEEDIPEIWRAAQLSRLEGPKAKHPGREQQQRRNSERPLQGDLGEQVGETCVVEYDDECDQRDYCIPEDESATAKGDYVSLLDNPERYTGYGGESAHMVWDHIYKENCFLKPPPPSASNPLGAFQTQAANDLRSVLQANAPSTEFSPDDSCMEKRVFYRVISGMHASISTHICNDYLNQTTGEWGPNLECYKQRLAAHPDRISNLYFNYALVLRAVAKLRPFMHDYIFCSGDPVQDKDTKSKVLNLVNQTPRGPAIFDETLMFSDPAVAGDLKEDFRQRFVNVSRMMDCVGCDKCRLWGKLQTVGYGTALKVLFEFDEGSRQPEMLKRTELVALVNTLARISASLSALEAFRDSNLNEQLSREAKDASAAEKERIFMQKSPKTEIKHVQYSDEEVDDEEDWRTMYNRQVREQTVKDSTLAELDLVWRTFKWVMHSWLELPGKVWSISLFEINRFWQFWIGHQVQPRGYGMTYPTHDEI